MIGKGRLEISGTPSAHQRAPVLLKDALTGVEASMAAFVYQESPCAKALVAPLLSAPAAIFNLADRKDFGATPRIRVQACTKLP